MRALRENPLLRYHLLGATRHRWRRQPWLYGAAVLGIGLVYLLVLQLTVYSEAGIDATLGLALFVMCLAAPLMAYNLFSLEYEKQTWESLALTRLTAREIFWGKYGAALARVALTTLLFAPFLLTTHRATTYVIVAAFTRAVQLGRAARVGRTVALVQAQAHAHDRRHAVCRAGVRAAAVPVPLPAIQRGQRPKHKHHRGGAELPRRYACMGALRFLRAL
jgi:hypothetical protein